MRNGCVNEFLSVMCDTCISLTTDAATLKDPNSCAELTRISMTTRTRVATTFQVIAPAAVCSKNAVWPGNTRGVEIGLRFFVGTLYFDWHRRAPEQDRRPANSSNRCDKPEPLRRRRAASSNGGVRAINRAELDCKHTEHEHA